MKRPKCPQNYVAGAELINEKSLNPNNYSVYFASSS